MSLFQEMSPVTDAIKRQSLNFLKLCFFFFLICNFKKDLNVEKSGRQSKRAWNVNPADLVGSHSSDAFCSGYKHRF